MISENKCIVMDLDGTICPEKEADQTYDDLLPYPDVIELLQHYKSQGYYIIVQTARNMRTYQGNIGLITANTAKQVLSWLDHHAVPHDEIHFGKPWNGHDGFYVDDKAIRLDEFLTQTPDDIQRTLADAKRRAKAMMADGTTLNTKIST